MAKQGNLRRIRRGDFIFATIGLEIAFNAAFWYLTGRLSLMLMSGLRTDALRFATGPFDLVLAAAVVHDLLFLWLIAARLQDANWPGWWALVILPMSFMGVIAVPPGIAALMAPAVLLALIALFFVPGTIGPNRFGPDPRGWRSREHFDEQQARLKSGNI